MTKVKRFQSEIIESPQTISPRVTIAEARQLMARLGIGGLPVVDAGLGLLTRRDVLLADDAALVSERMTPRERLVVATPGISIAEARRLMSERRLEKLPLVDAHGRLAGLITAKDLSRDVALGHATRDDKGRLRVAAAVGVVGDYLERAQALQEAGADALVVDIAHGDSQAMLAALGELRERLGDLPIVAGNIATAEAAERLIQAGADALKVGVGPGSMCITRLVAGAGVPQFSAVLECAHVAQRHGVPVIADGGVRYAGDVATGHRRGGIYSDAGQSAGGHRRKPRPGNLAPRPEDEGGKGHGLPRGGPGPRPAGRPGPGLVALGVRRGGRGGGGHPGAGGLSRRGAGGAAAPAVGPASGMSYSGATSVPEMWRKARFVRQTMAGIRESGPHDVGEF